jgi:hypothetical protein
LPPQPGINGLRYSAEKGYVYYTTTGQKLFMRLRVDPATGQTAPPPGTGVRNAKVLRMELA